MIPKEDLVVELIYSDEAVVAGYPRAALHVTHTQTGIQVILPNITSKLKSFQVAQEMIEWALISNN